MKSLKSANGMFHGYIGSSINVTHWNTKELVIAENMFRVFDGILPAPNVTLWNMGNVQTVKRMFQQTTIFQDLDISTWDTGNVVDMDFFLYGCNYTSPNFSNWNLQNVTHCKGVINTYYRDHVAWLINPATDYDAILVAFEQNSNATCNWGILVDTYAQAINANVATGEGFIARYTLIPRGWTIADGGFQ